MTIIDTDDIRSHYRGHGHWFDADAIRFFHSRVAATAYKTDDGSRAYFVSSERYDFDTARKFTVRVYNFETHDIRTVGARARMLPRGVSRVIPPARPSAYEHPYFAPAHVRKTTHALA